MRNIKRFFKPHIKKSVVIALAAALVLLSIPVSVTTDQSGFLSTGSNVALAVTDIPATEVVGQSYSIGDEVIEKRTENSKTFDLGAGKRQLVTSIGAVHYKDTLNTWQDIDNSFTPAVAPWNWQMTQDSYKTYVLNNFTAGQVLKLEFQGSTIAFQPMALQWINNLNQLQQISMPQNVPVSITNTDNLGTIRWDNAYGVGKHFEWTNTPSRLSKLLILDTIPLSPPQYIIDGGEPTLKLDFIFAPSSDLEVWLDGQLWDKQTKRQTVNIIEFRKGGKVIGVFNPIRYWGSDPESETNEGMGTTVLSKSGTNLFVSALVPYSWLQTAVYPVRIDPTWQVGASTDDCYRNLSGPSFSLTLPYQIAGADSASDNRRGGGMRFTNITIPQGATIENGTNLILRAAFSKSGTTVNSRISAEDVDDAITFANDAAAFDTRWAARTTARVDWEVGAWTVGTDYDSPEIKTVIKEIVDRVGWVSGQDMVIFWDDFDRRSTEAADCLRMAYAYDGSTTYCPQLVIAYSGTAVSAPIVTTQAVSSIATTTATGNGNITDDGDETPSAWGVCVAETENPDTGDDVFAGSGAGAVGAFIAAMTGLTPGQLYYVRAYATNTGGTGYGSQVEFSTEGLPSVTTSAANIDTLNGNITDTGYVTGYNYRGFVWGTTHIDNPGDTSPATSGYDSNWTEEGSFDVGEFNHLAEDLSEFTLYYFRACAHNPYGWAYGGELEFFIGEADKVYLEFRPDLDETRIRGNAGIPSDAQVGIYNGYSLPIWNSNDEELYFLMCVPDRWDGESHILIHVITALANANESGNSYQLEIAWEHETPNEDFIPVTSNTATITRTIYSDTQYESYMDWAIILYNADVGDDIKPDDQLTFRFRRIAAGEQLKDLDGELIILSTHILFARGDLLGDPDSVVTTTTFPGLIDDLIVNETLVGGEGVLFIGFIVLCLGLMISGFILKAIPLVIGGGLAWVGLGIYGLNSESIGLTAGMNHLLLGLGLVMAFVCFVLPITWTMTKRKEALAKSKKDYKSEADTYSDELRQIQKDARRQRR